MGATRGTMRHGPGPYSGKELRAQRHSIPSTLALKFGDVFHSDCLAEGFLMRVDLGNQYFQVVSASYIIAPSNH